MTESQNVFAAVDEIIERVDLFKIEPLFSREKLIRQNKKVPDSFSDNEILKIFAYLIAFSQNSNSEIVEQVLASGKFDQAFDGFNIDTVARLNPCDIADKYWPSIKGIRQQAKLFHIVSLARKIKNIGSFAQILYNIQIPKEITTSRDLDAFWNGFDNLQLILKNNKIPFFQSTTSLLHFLLEIGYDCIKPDLVVLKVARELGILNAEKGDRVLRRVVRVLQEYSIDRKIRPSVVDLYLLVYGVQLGSKKLVRIDFYK